MRIDTGAAPRDAQLLHGKILLVRGDGVGDALALAPLVAALRDAGHAVSAVLSTGNAEAYGPEVFTRTHVLERIPWPKHGSTAVSYRREVARARAVRYDVALIASEEPEAYRFADAARVPVRVGFLTGFARPFKTLALRPYLTRTITRSASAQGAREHEVETLFRLGDGLHDELLPTADVARLRPLVSQRPAAESFGVVVLQYSARARVAGGPSAMPALARALRSRYETLVVGSPADAPALAALEAELGAPCFTYTRARAWIDEIAGARALVTYDGGAAHVAGMTGVPCVDLFPANDRTAFDTLRWRPWAAPSRTLVPGLDAERTARETLAALAELIGPGR